MYRCDPKASSEKSVEYIRQQRKRAGANSRDEQERVALEADDKKHSQRDARQR